MSEWLARLFDRKPVFRPGLPAAPRLALTESCVCALADCLQPESQRSHEGIVYLLGQTNGSSTLFTTAVRPQSETTHGSFSVTAPAMARVVRTAAAVGLQVVGQVHTHPGRAYHSEGDVEGARIVYDGFVSVVLPEYGRRLPALHGAAVYMYRQGQGFVEISADHVDVIPGRLP